MNDSISRKDLKLWVEQCDEDEWMHPGFIKVERLLRKLEKMPSAQPEPQWIPVKFRPMDSEEREYWEDYFGYELPDEDAVLFDCQMPDDGQEILVSYRKWIGMDKCEIDCGCYGLEGNGDWEDVIAWMPAPFPYEGKEKSL